MLPVAFLLLMFVIHFIEALGIEVRAGEDGGGSDGDGEADSETPAAGTPVAAAS